MSAIGFLGILIYGIMLLSLISVVSLVLSAAIKNNTIKNVIYILVTLYSLFLSFINFTSGPSNYILPYVIGILCALLTISGAFLKFSKKKASLAYTFIFLSIVIATMSILF